MIIYEKVNHFFFVLELYLAVQIIRTHRLMYKDNDVNKIITTRLLYFSKAVIAPTSGQENMG